MEMLIKFWEDLLETAAMWPNSMITWKSQAEGAEGLFYAMHKDSNKELANEARQIWSNDYRIRFDSIEVAHYNAIDKMYEED